MLHDLHKYSVLHQILQFSCLLTIRVHPVFHFQLFLTCCLTYFVTHILFFI
jgi:hypothetical protein